MSNKKDRQDKTEQSPTGGPQPTNITTLCSDVQRLEKRVDELNAGLFDRHLKVITVIVSSVAGLIAVCAIIVTVLGFLSKSETREAKEEMRLLTKSMEGRIEKATVDMEARFRVLAGDAFKRPLLAAILQDGSPLEGRTNIIFNQGEKQIYSLVLTNAGDRRTDPLSIRISTAPLCDSGNYNEWDRVMTGNTNLATSFYSKRTMTTIAPGQSINIPPLPLFCEFPDGTLCELEVFYGGERPIRSRFYISTR